MSEPVRFPLQWPVGWERTPAHERMAASFRKGGSATRDPVTGIGGRAPTRALSVPDALARLSQQLGLLEATHEVLSTNLQVRLDGLIKGGQVEPADPGAAVYFRLHGAARCLACDRWTRLADNIAAIAQHVDALRRIDRYGVGSLDQVFAGYAALPPTSADWWIILGVPRDATREQIETAFRALARRYHPDSGGDHTAMARINDARRVALGER
jgi:DnaJ domain